MAEFPDPLSKSLSSLSKTVIYAIETTANFKPQLKRLSSTLDTIYPAIEETVKKKRELDDTERECKMLIDEIQQAEELVNKCLKVEWNYFKRFLYSRELKYYNCKLLKFFQLEVQAIQLRDIVQTRVVVNNIESKVDRMYSDNSIRTLEMKMDRLYSDGHSNRALELNHIGSESVERKKYGWRVPRLQRGIVAFLEPLEKLKDEVVAGIGIDDSGSSMGCDDRWVLVVAAPGGFGKTTLVNMLCHDVKIREFFGENIFYVTVSERPNLMVIVNNLFNSNPNSPHLLYQSDEDARYKLDEFLNEKASVPMLPVLDDVWSASFIEENFPSKIRGHRILVTSRTAFPGYTHFTFQPLDQGDAKTLFCASAFTEGGSGPSPTIDDNLVNQMVQWCKRHPLTLLVAGRSLNGKEELAWKSMLGKLSRGRSVVDLHEDVLTRLERSFEALDKELKECFLDFGLFPEDQRIPVSALLNMWMHLYEHEDGGVDTMNTIFELSYRNLANYITASFRNDSSARINYCDQQFVTQHDLLRELAIHISSKPPLAQRSRLIINAIGEDLPAIEQVQEPMKARIFSISTGESFSSRWCNMEVPYLEVLILNLMSKTYTLPHFLEGLQKFKILNITNHGLYPTQFTNFDILTSSHNLTRIRLERVAISPSILSIISLQKVSFIMCKIDSMFTELVVKTPNIWPQLVEIEIDYCQDLVEFPGTLCNSVHLKTISITNCNEMCGLSEEFGNLTNLKTLSLRSCTKLEKIPESIWRLEKLSDLDISDCLSLSGLPENMGKLGNLRTIFMKGCTGIHELPESVEEWCDVRVVCNEEMAHLWQEYSNVEINRVEEDRLETLMKIIPVV